MAIAAYAVEAESANKLIDGEFKLVYDKAQNEIQFSPENVKFNQVYNKKEVDDILVEAGHFDDDAFADYETGKDLAPVRDIFTGEDVQPVTYRMLVDTIAHDMRNIDEKLTQHEDQIHDAAVGLGEHEQAIARLVNAVGPMTFVANGNDTTRTEMTNEGDFFMPGDLEVCGRLMTDWELIVNQPTPSSYVEINVGESILNHEDRIAELEANPSGGTLKAGTAIDISNDTINVKYDPDTLAVTDGKLTVVGGSGQSGGYWIRNPTFMETLPEHDALEQYDYVSGVKNIVKQVGIPETYTHYSLPNITVDRSFNRHHYITIQCTNPEMSWHISTIDGDAIIPHLSFSNGEVSCRYDKQNVDTIGIYTIDEGGTENVDFTWQAEWEGDSIVFTRPLNDPLTGPDNHLTIVNENRHTYSWRISHPLTAGERIHGEEAVLYDYWLNVKEENGQLKYYTEGIKEAVHNTLHLTYTVRTNINDWLESKLANGSITFTYTPWLNMTFTGEDNTIAPIYRVDTTKTINAPNIFEDAVTYGDVMKYIATLENVEEKSEYPYTTIKFKNLTLPKDYVGELFRVYLPVGSFPLENAITPDYISCYVAPDYKIHTEKLNYTGSHFTLVDTEVTEPMFMLDTSTGMTFKNMMNLGTAVVQYMVRPSRLVTDKDIHCSRIHADNVFELVESGVPYVYEPKQITEIEQSYDATGIWSTFQAPAVTATRKLWMMDLGFQTDSDRFKELPVGQRISWTEPTIGYSLSSTKTKEGKWSHQYTNLHVVRKGVSTVNGGSAKPSRGMTKFGISINEQTMGILFATVPWMYHQQIKNDSTDEDKRKIACEIWKWLWNTAKKHREDLTFPFYAEVNKSNPEYGAYLTVDNYWENADLAFEVAKDFTSIYLTATFDNYADYAEQNVQFDLKMVYPEANIDWHWTWEVRASQASYGQHPGLFPVANWYTRLPCNFSENVQTDNTGLIMFANPWLTPHEDEFYHGENIFEYAYANDMQQITPKTTGSTSLKTDKSIISNRVVMARNLESHLYSMNGIGNELMHVESDIEYLQQAVSTLAATVESINDFINLTIVMDIATLSIGGLIGGIAKVKELGSLIEREATLGEQTIARVIENASTGVKEVRYGGEAMSHVTTEAAETIQHVVKTTGEQTRIAIEKSEGAVEAIVDAVKTGSINEVKAVVRNNELTVIGKAADGEWGIIYTNDQIRKTFERRVADTGRLLQDEVITREAYEAAIRRYEADALVEECAWVRQVSREGVPVTVSKIETRVVSEAPVELGRATTEIGAKNVARDGTDISSAVVSADASGVAKMEVSTEAEQFILALGEMNEEQRYMFMEALDKAKGEKLLVEMTPQRISLAHDASDCQWELLATTDEGWTQLAEEVMGQKATMKRAMEYNQMGTYNRITEELMSAQGELKGGEHLILTDMQEETGILIRRAELVAVREGRYTVKPVEGEVRVTMKAADINEVGTEVSKAEATMDAAGSARLDTKVISETPAEAETTIASSTVNSAGEDVSHAFISTSASGKAEIDVMCENETINAAIHNDDGALAFILDAASRDKYSEMKATYSSDKLQIVAKKHGETKWEWVYGDEEYREFIQKDRSELAERYYERQLTMSEYNQHMYNSIKGEREERSFITQSIAKEGEPLVVTGLETRVTADSVKAGQGQVVLTARALKDESETNRATMVLDAVGEMEITTNAETMRTRWISNKNDKCYRLDWFGDIIEETAKGSGTVSVYEDADLIYNATNKDWYITTPEGVCHHVTDVGKYVRIDGKYVEKSRAEFQMAAGDMSTIQMWGDSIQNHVNQQWAIRAGNLSEEQLASLRVGRFDTDNEIRLLINNSLFQSELRQMPDDFHLVIQPKKNAEGLMVGAVVELDTKATGWNHFVRQYSETGVDIVSELAETATATSHTTLVTATGQEPIRDFFSRIVAQFKNAFDDVLPKSKAEIRVEAIGRTVIEAMEDLGLELLSLAEDATTVAVQHIGRDSAIGKWFMRFWEAAAGKAEEAVGSIFEFAVKLSPELKQMMQYLMYETPYGVLISMKLREAEVNYMRIQDLEDRGLVVSMYTDEIEIEKANILWKGKSLTGFASGDMSTWTDTQLVDAKTVANILANSGNTSGGSSNVAKILEDNGFKVYMDANLGYIFQAKPYSDGTAFAYINFVNPAGQPGPIGGMTFAESDSDYSWAISVRGDEALRMSKNKDTNKTSIAITGDLTVNGKSIYTKDEVDAMMQPLLDRIAALEAKLNTDEFTVNKLKAEEIVVGDVMKLFCTPSNRARAMIAQLHPETGEWSGAFTIHRNIHPTDKPERVVIMIGGGGGEAGVLYSPPSRLADVPVVISNTVERPGF